MLNMALPRKPLEKYDTDQRYVTRLLVYVIAYSTAMEDLNEHWFSVFGSNVLSSCSPKDSEWD